ncbi:MAG TPA: phosphoribosylamine--glycine ligase [Dehalococcoidia bacterium]|nr:phosphoribosylamine--glycine ligase [Dehalococcoidia bacterium]
MNVLLVGSGAREHALAWKLRQSPRLTDLFVAPGNAGTATLGINLPLKANDLEGLARAARENRCELVVVGPEEPLARGLVDRLAVEGIAAFGPSRAAARIESSKAFAKELMQRHGIPTARTAVFSNRTDARNHVEGLSAAPVVKADGLAAGKGAIVCETKEEALQAIDSMMGKEASFGEAGRTVVVEERLEGREVSAHAFSDGRATAPMPFSCDYKRALDGDGGLNTGGMGAYSPPGWLDEALASQIDREVTVRAVEAMAEDGVPYRGVLYPGIMVTPDGPKVLEFNCRLGDPEAQVLLPRLKTDLLEVCLAVVNNRLHELAIEWSEQACVGVVLASGGYPEEYATGLPVSGLGQLEPDALVFHAGTALAEDGSVVTSGGRVLTVAAMGEDLTEARAKAYRNVQRIHFSRCHYRRDIAAPAQAARVE